MYEINMYERLGVLTEACFTEFIWETLADLASAEWARAGRRGFADCARRSS